MDLLHSTVAQPAYPLHATPVELSAESIGCRVQRSACEGSVAAVFQRACNIALDSGGMLAVLVQNAGNVPHGVRLTCSPRLDRTLHARMPVRVSRDRLVFAGGAVIVSLSGASTWTPGVQPGLCTWHPSAVDAASYLVRELSMRAPGSASDVLRAVVGSHAADRPLAARFRELLSMLSRSLQMRNAVCALACIGQLIGLGPGLTPAGDDFVIGWLAGLTLTAATPEHISFLQSVREGMAPLQTKTTLVSWQHLDDALGLMFSERLSDVCVTIAAGGPTALLATRLDAQLAVGASSGADAAAGLLFALRESCPQLQSLFLQPT